MFGPLGQRGFTLVELIMATALFSVVMLAMTSGVLQLFKIYQAGVSIRNTQQSARLISEEIVRLGRGADHFTVGSLNSAIATADGFVDSPTDALCIYPDNRPSGTIFYLRPASGAINQYNLYKGRINSDDCRADSDKIEASEQLNGVAVSVLKFDISVVNGSEANFGMDIAASSAINAADLERSGGRIGCRAQIGSQYCSITRLDSSATTRVKGAL
ncbi:MAG TPA: prepilin-type N-terminal cleavage/methylation domain-containing protein [Candidatus Dormibacteraeota bacterium]|nr:prepilin-type N-terminal cleavage/methylation domain-containing protein [Candidatus Dormibacteraeota bacterium]